MRGLLALGFSVLLLAGCSVDPSAAPTATPSDTPSAQSDSPSPAAAAPAPERLSIDAIGVDTGLVSLGLAEDETVEVPSNPDDAGWYTLGPSPGEDGSAVILGHVDSPTGPAVFAQLPSLQVGDEIDVTRKDGSQVTFSVARVATYANEDFPANKVYASTPGFPTLRLVTCGGDYDAANGGYQSNVVVYANLVTP
ncbi:class F sortase [Aeromicrobium phragmitis]|uniref:Class F sortase n=1 Tax=Aeromicrobium phragmitis TaxID=2478914 RepID=A0A3L8PMX8_9ACTN|nr:class F sortase [Aeromicrobium phragmitis]RLV56747.1 class F sortase [Aeromicrobium phragmitis]